MMSDIFEIMSRDETMSYLADIVQVDVLKPPAPLTPLKGDGTTDCTSAIQLILNSLEGKTGKVLFPSNNVYVISSLITIPESIEIVGTLSTRYGHTGSDVPTTVIKWNGATNGTMFNFNRPTYTQVIGAKLRNLSFDGNNIAGVTVMDMTNSQFGLVDNCNFTQMANGIYFTWPSAYNLIKRCTFEYFTGKAINLDPSKGAPNDNTFQNNVFSFSNPNSYGIFVKGGNSNKTILNRFEGYAAGIEPIHIEGNNALDTVVAFSRFEHEWHLNQGQTAITMINIKNINGRPLYTKLIGNQFYPEEHDAATDAVHDNFNYVLVDEGYGTICDDFIEDNLIPNGSMCQINGTIPIWKSNDASYTATYNATEDAVQCTVTNSTTKYPYFYNIINAQKFRGKSLVLSVLYKVDNITSSPTFDVNLYKGGDGTLANLGTYINSYSGNISAYKTGDYMLLVGTLDVTTDTDDIFINVNPNGKGLTTPANNNIYVKFICLSEKRAFKVNPNQDNVMNSIQMVYPTSSRPTGTKGMMIIDSTLNKPIWFDGSSWRDSTGAIV